MSNNDWLGDSNDNWLNDISSGGIDHTFRELGSNSHRIELVQLTITEMPSFHTMYARPYTSNLDMTTRNNIVNRVSQNNNTNQHTTIEASLLAGLVCDVISPQASPAGEIAISNGWGAQRLAFALEVHIHYPGQSSKIRFYQGYTDWNGVSNTGSIAPDMTFTINSYTCLSRLVGTTPLGMRSIDRFVEAKNILGPNNMTDSGYGHHRNPMMAMRPTEIYHGMEIQPAIQEIAAFDPSAGKCYVPGLVLNDLKLSNRSYANPTTYIAGILDTYNLAALETDMNSSNDQYELTTKMISVSGDFNASEDPFISKISEMFGYTLRNTFTFEQLLRIDQTINKRTNVTRAGVSAMTKYGSPMLDCEKWVGSNTETRLATMLASSIPALMAELLISDIKFTSTNKTINGQIITEVGQMKMYMKTDEASRRRTESVFESKFKQIIALDFTHGNKDSYELIVESNIYLHTLIQIGINDGVLTPFAIPQFTDSLSSPIITNSQSSNFNRIVENFKEIASGIVDDRNGHTPFNNALPYRGDTVIEQPVFYGGASTGSFMQPQQPFGGMNNSLPQMNHQFNSEPNYRGVL